MTQTTCAAGCTCCQQGNQADRDDMLQGMRIVNAGDACDSECVGFEAPMDMTLAMIHFPVQTYRAGFCPSEALMKGTLFPELVSPYTRGC
ncbi:MAG: spore coat associated protein CotJA [Clostridia bacterium]